MAARKTKVRKQIQNEITMKKIPMRFVTFCLGIGLNMFFTEYKTHWLESEINHQIKRKYK